MTAEQAKSELLNGFLIAFAPNGLWDEDTHTGFQDRLDILLTDAAAKERAFIVALLTTELRRAQRLDLVTQYGLAEAVNMITLDTAATERGEHTEGEDAE